MKGDDVLLHSRREQAIERMVCSVIVIAKMVCKICKEEEKKSPNGSRAAIVLKGDGSEAEMTKPSSSPHSDLNDDTR
jgi:hypothetical protein